MEKKNIKILLKIDTGFVKYCTDLHVKKSNQNRKQFKINEEYVQLCLRKSSREWKTKAITDTLRKITYN